MFPKKFIVGSCHSQKNEENHRVNDLLVCYKVFLLINDFLFSLRGMKCQQFLCCKNKNERIKIRTTLSLLLMKQKSPAIKISPLQSSAILQCRNAIKFV